jgi:hypothetical protein
MNLFKMPLFFVWIRIRILDATKKMKKNYFFFLFLFDSDLLKSKNNKK